MGNAVTVRGRFSDPTHIELSQPVTDITGSVEVVLRPLPPVEPVAGVKTLLGLCADLGTAPSAAEIDEVRREMWRNFPREDI